MTEEQYVYFNSGGTSGRRRIYKKGDAGYKDSFESIPVIDCSTIYSDDIEVRRKLAGEIGKACREVGFFYVKNPPGVTKEDIDSTFKVVREFFDTPVEEKLKVHWHNSAAYRGYEPFGQQLRESFTCGDDFLDEEQASILAASGVTVPEGALPQNQWPAHYPELRRALYKWYLATYRFARALLRIFALALGLDEDAFEDQYKFPIVGMRALHYPPQPPDEENPSLGAHSDFSAFTLVMQEPDSAPSLEVLNQNGQWISAPPLKDVIWTTNVGDFLAAITNDEFKSTIHRVFNRNAARRYSLPLFFGPEPSAVLKVLPGWERGDGRDLEDMVVGKHYVRRVVHGRPDHPNSVLLKERAVPEDRFEYCWMTHGLPEDVKS